LVRSDAAFREEALDEILQMHVVTCRPYAEVWRSRARRRAARGDWAGANRDFAAPETPAYSLTAADLLATACLLRLAGNDEGANRLAREVDGFSERPLQRFRDGSPAPTPDTQIPLWVRLLERSPDDSIDLVRRAERYLTKSLGEGRYIHGAASLRAGRLDEAVSRFEESLAVERDWPMSGLNAYGLSLAHHRLGHPDQARGWLDRAESWLKRLDQTYSEEAPGIRTGQPPVAVTFEFWVYAQVLRREIAGPILDAAFPADPFAQ
jgi:hypothetical protein